MQTVETFLIFFSRNFFFMRSGFQYSGVPAFQRSFVPAFSTNPVQPITTLRSWREHLAVHFVTPLSAIRLSASDKSDLFTVISCASRLFASLKTTCFPTRLVIDFRLRHGRAICRFAPEDCG